MIRYAKSLSKCDEENLINVKKIQNGFKMIVLKDQDVISYSENIDNSSLKNIVEDFTLSSIIQKVNDIHDYIKTDNFGNWLRHMSNGYMIYEQPNNNISNQYDFNWEDINELVDYSLWKLTNIICIELKKALNCERVMFYKFDEN